MKYQIGARGAVVLKNNRLSTSRFQACIDRGGTTEVEYVAYGASQAEANARASELVKHLNTVFGYE